MAELMHQDEHGQPDTELRAVERSVDSGEAREGQQKLELEERQEQLALDQEQRERREWAELARPRRGIGC
jgi:hypothetical protein